ncbi:DegT/DnrJ/EryC1/StrS family aminotransferase [Polynucleobacter paneuropaeus]|nr:DegT/DnrJ/EryC1/StrS family aminotransferase [Polynucleobacter paneuropaeus]
MRNVDPITYSHLKEQYVRLGSKIRARIEGVLNHGQYILGPEVKELEDRLKQYTGSKFCITVSSGTEALLISLMALGIGPGDEVVTTSFSFAATAEVIALVGATPIFVDIESDTCNLDPKKLLAAITENTKAIIPVSLYGQPSNMEAINAIVNKCEIPVIEDGAQSFGAEFLGKKSCNLSTIGCTSFFPSKPLGCYGDGGAIFTNDENLAAACKEIRVHGQSSRYFHARIGVGGRMDTMQCAVLLAKMDAFSDEVEMRLEVGNRYNNLMDSKGIQRVVQRPSATSVFAQYTIFVENRNGLQVALDRAQIPYSVHYPMPINEQKAYQRWAILDSTPIASRNAKNVISLPMHPYLTMDQQKMIVDVVASYQDKNSA